MLDDICGSTDGGEPGTGARALLGPPCAPPDPEAGQGPPLGLEMVSFSGEGRSVWATVQVNVSPESQSSTHTVVSPVALKVALGWLSVMLTWVFRASPFWRVQEMVRVS